MTPFRPPSAMAAGGPPGTGRLGTARAPSSYGVERGVGVGLNAQLQVQDRPFTKEGMAGMRTATASRRVVSVHVHVYVCALFQCMRTCGGVVRCLCVAFSLVACLWACLCGIFPMP